MQSKADNPLRSLRILMIVHLPWERNLGGSRVQVELADEFRRLGHVVEKFDYTDAFPRQPTTRIGKLLPRDFSRHAKAFVRANAARFDVIEANQTDLPFSKRELGFDGLLVARSAGLKPMYAEFLEQARRRWPTQKKGHPIAEIVREWNNRRHLRLVEPSLRAADLIIVPNRDELSYISGVYGIGVKCVRMPFGLSVAQHETFARTADYPAVRLTSKQVAFIGSWDCRKGSEDWPSIVRAVLARVPDAKFLFVGTGRSREWILGYLGHELGEKVEVISKYVNTDLPMLLWLCSSGKTCKWHPDYCI
jgi:glycosyltransferase involved in cell wall biosynthesis